VVRPSSQGCEVRHCSQQATVRIVQLDVDDGARIGQMLMCAEHADIVSDADLALIPAVRVRTLHEPFGGAA
jgi:hypothetical protein